MVSRPTGGSAIIASSFSLRISSLPLFSPHAYRRVWRASISKISKFDFEKFNLRRMKKENHLLWNFLLHFTENILFLISYKVILF
jgi:hypothetical protein